MLFFLFFKQKTADEVRISDWSSDVCSSDLGADSIRLFEIGRRYLADAERPTLALLMAGDKSARGWQAGKAAPFDAFDAKAAALALLDAAGAPADRLQVMEAVSEGAIWHPGQSATLRLGPKEVLAEFGAQSGRAHV